MSGTSESTVRHACQSCYTVIGLLAAPKETYLLSSFYYIYCEQGYILQECDIARLRANPFNNFGETEEVKKKPEKLLH